MGYSKSQPEIFKISHLGPIQDLKLLVRDYPVSVWQSSSRRTSVALKYNVSDGYVETAILRHTGHEEVTVERRS